MNKAFSSMEERFLLRPEAGVEDSLFGTLVNSLTLNSAKLLFKVLYFMAILFSMSHKSYLESSISFSNNMCMLACFITNLKQHHCQHLTIRIGYHLR
jgi:hypothetical protein